jgi:hypothetical protein
LVDETRQGKTKEGKTKAKTKAITEINKGR